MMPYARLVPPLNHIAVLGLEVFEIRSDGLLTVDYSGYDDELLSPEQWIKYARAMNTEAENCVNSHRYGNGHGYIITSASEAEFADLQKTRKSSSILSKILGHFP
jgi:hypothetical protein